MLDSSNIFFARHMPAVISIILPQFMLILFGRLLKKFKPFNLAFWSSMEAMVFYVLFPPLLFSSVAKSSFSLGMSARFLLIAVFCMLIAVFLSWFINRFYKESAWTKWSVFHCGFRFNTYIGFAICSPLLGTEGIALLSLLIAIWVPISNTIAVAGLAYATNKDEKFSLVKLVKTVAKNPLIIATALGLVANVTGIHIPEFLDKFLSYLGNASLALGLLCIGAGLTFADLKKYKQLILLCSIERLVLVPVTATVVSLLLLPNATEACVLILFAALPTAQSCYVMTSKMNGNGAAVADLTSFQTLMAMITLPCWVALMMYYFLA